MGSRLMVTALLTVAIVLSSAGTSMAVSGAAGGGSAGSVQYPKNNAEQGEVLGGPQAQSPGGGAGGGGGGAAPSETTQRTTAAGSSGLPFTGWAVLPLLVVGIGLLTGGALLRRTPAARVS